MVSKAMLIEKEKSIEGILNTLEKIRKKIISKQDKIQIQLYITIVRYVLLSVNNAEIRKILQTEIEKMKGVDENMLHATMVINREIEERTNKAMAKGRAEGMNQGRAEGRAEGKAEGIKI